MAQILLQYPTSTTTTSSTTTSTTNNNNDNWFMLLLCDSWGQIFHHLENIKFLCIIYLYAIKFAKNDNSNNN